MSNHRSSPPESDLVALAMGLHQRGRLDEADELYRRVLDRAPRHVDALHFYGVLCHQRGDAKAAARLIRKALKIDPQYIGARINLGNVLKEEGRFADAEAEYRKVTESGADDADAFNNLGAVLRSQKKLAAAIECFQRATVLSPRHVDAYHNLGNALKSAGRIEEALTAYRKAIEIDSGHSDSHSSLGRALYGFGRVAEAEIVYRKWLETDPANPIAAHMLSACQGDRTLLRCSDEFVRDSFDSFAASFEEVLERLEYRVPELIRKVIEAELPNPEKQFCVLDAGCGTGLCGPCLKPYARELVGVDLAPKMVVKARSLGLYDQLIVSELTAHMRQHSQRYDLIIAADTLVYFGALEPVFRAAAAALRPGGMFVFTLERIDQETSESVFRLQPHGRYCHSESFVRAALAEAGLSVREFQHETLRLELRRPVDGMVVTAELRG